MTHRIKVNTSGKTITIADLTISNPDFFTVVAAQPEGKREHSVLDIIAFGSAAMLRVQTTMDVDFVERRFGALLAKFDSTLGGFERQATDTLAKRFSPTESGSYVKHLGELVASARKDVQGWTTDLAKAARDLLDPDKKSSAVGRVEQIIEHAAEQFEQMFDPDVKDSYASQLNEELRSLFGGHGRVGVLQAALEKLLKPVLDEVRAVKEEVKARKAAEQVIASSSLKGRPFEELVHFRLSQLAQPFGDDVLAVGSGNGGSRAGDFLVTVNGSGNRIVVEARDRRQMSLPSIKEDMERQLKEREADLAIYVSSGPEMLPQHVGDFQVYEDKLVTTLEHLHISYRLGRLLAMSKSPEGEIDVAALRAVLGRIKDSGRSLRDVKTKATQVKKLAEGIHSDAETTECEILDLLSEAERLLGGSGTVR